MATQTTIERIGSAVAGNRTFELYDVSWDQYEALLDCFGDRYLRHTYFEGTLELVSPSRNHEWVKTLMGDFVSVICRVLQMPRQGHGSTTMRRQVDEGGLEGDEGFFFDKDSVEHFRGRDEYDANVDPPPDLMIEVDVSSSSEQRMMLYARMKVPEVWRYQGERVTIYRLGREGTYREAETSKWFPMLTGKDLTRFVEMRHEMDDTSLEMQFEQWLRSEVDKRDNA